MANLQEKPLLFISHKHADSQIASKLANFIRFSSQNRVRVYLSSDPSYVHPEYGRSLNNELRNALGEADALILIFTSEDQDWSYCMWECGVATDPKNPPTNIYVFQCGEGIPKPFADIVRINAKEPNDIRRFTNFLLRDPTFFPRRGEAIAPDIEKQDCDTLADKLLQDLREVIPEGLNEKWSPWPYLRVELAQEHVTRIEQANADEKQRLSLEILAEHGVIVESSPLTPQLFGMAYFQSRLRFKDLLQMWKNKYPDAEPQWFTSCCEQFREGVSRGRPLIREAHLKEVDGEREYTPVLSRIRRIPLLRVIELDIYFYYLADPRGVSVTSIMIPNGNFFTKNLGQLRMDTIKLDKLIEEIESLGKNRVPLLNGDGCPLYIVHRSMIDQFIAKQAMKGQTVTELTLDDLLGDDAMKRMFETTFIVVSERASLAEAKSAMLSVRDCRDVFVTAGGTRDEPLLGWITNVRLVARLPDQHRFI
jgi:hypothetical protein